MNTNYLGYFSMTPLYIMNIIEEQRQQIINNNNTAQNYIDSVIQNMNKLSDDLIISEQLYGEIDLSALSDFKIKKVVFAPGSITSIIHIPDSVTTINISENLLVELNNLPKLLKHLDVNHNYLTKINLDDLKLLEVLNISHNQIEELPYLPPLLLELNCSNNKLTTLNLETSKKIETLDIGYNNITTIYGYPESVINFDSTNNPSIEYIDSDITPEENGKKEEKHDYFTSLNTYYKFKTLYESQLKEIRKKAYIKSKSKKQHQLNLKGIYGRCVYCRRNVGSVFIENDEKIVAHCGSTNDPCKFNIELIKGFYNDIRYVLNEYKQGVIETQNNIIRQKMDILFDYRNEKDIVDEYQELINDMETFNSEYTELLNKYNKLFNDEEKQATLTKMNVELFEFKQEFLQHLKEFNNTNNREHLHAAMNLHRNHIFVLKRRLHNIEYNVLEVYQENIKKDIFTFNKQEHTLSNMETSVDIDRVKHFVVKN